MWTLVHSPKMTTKKPPIPGGKTLAERRRESNQRGRAAETLLAQDIGSHFPPPEEIDWDRREETGASLRVWCETYFPEEFSLAWSEDHLKVIAKIEEAVTTGGQFALAMPRGSGKTSLCEAAAMWAVANGHQNYILLIGATEAAAVKIISSIKSTLQHNHELSADWPDFSYAFSALEGSARKCEGQRFHGEKTCIVWREKELVFPTLVGLDYQMCAGSVIQVTGIDGSFRGAKMKRPDGKTIRPSLVILDDPQTRESAESPVQCAKKEALINADIKGLKGPKKSLAVLMPCTVIRPGDLAERFLDRAKNPAWHGERMKMLYSFPGDLKLWDEYNALRAESLRTHGDTRLSTEFYQANLEAMNAGASVAWPERFEPGELSAIQHAMNLFFDDRAAFSAEYQNDPMPIEAEGEARLDVGSICERINRVPRASVPVESTQLTAFIDVQGNLLYWAVCAWSETFGGAVLDYGAYPDQRRFHFALRDANPTLADMSPASGLEGSIRDGLDVLTESILGREYARGDGARLRVERCLIDANWPASTEVVYKFCRESRHAAIVMPSHGKYYGAKTAPFMQYRVKAGEVMGLHWLRANIVNKRAIRHVTYDTNFWKSFIFERFSQSIGDRGALTLFGDRPHDHQLFAEHMTAEFRVRVTANGRKVDEWQISPNRPDNHWFDCMVGCAVGASMLGCSLPEHQGIVTGRRRTSSWSSGSSSRW